MKKKNCPKEVILLAKGSPAAVADLLHRMNPAPPAGDAREAVEAVAPAVEMSTIRLEDIQPHDIPQKVREAIISEYEKSRPLSPDEHFGFFLRLKANMYNEDEKQKYIEACKQEGERIWEEEKEKERREKERDANNIPR